MVTVVVIALTGPVTAWLLLFGPLTPVGQVLAAAAIPAGLAAGFVAVAALSDRLDRRRTPTRPPTDLEASR